MWLQRLGERGHELPAVVHEGQTFDARSVADDYNGEFFEHDGIARLRRALDSGDLPCLIHADGMRVGAPIARPSAVYCIGMNYAAHAAESGSSAPDFPIMFMKAPNTIVGPNDDVILPPGSTRTDWEVELAVVIGRQAAYLGEVTESRTHIAGYAIANDLSERDHQLTVSGGQWSKGKSSPGFCPLGPFLVPETHVRASELRLRSCVNGEARQDSSTADMIFDVPTLIWHLSQYVTLEPGDVVLTGTPEGVALSGRFPYLSDGDVVELQIDGLGVQRQSFRTFT